ncbi:MAG: 6-pyruvoyl trahydropterin synthase family protein [Capsulimonadaceae bacterium]
MTMYLRRRIGFSAGDSGLLSGTPGGHNYLCELTVSGEIDPVTGMVVNIVAIDAVLKASVCPLDGKLLDRDVRLYRERPPTPENLALDLYRSCARSVPRECRAESLTLWWLPSSRVRVSATTENRLMITMTRTYEFSASHRLHANGLSAQENAAVFGKCNRENGHGHNYEVEVTVAGEPDPATGELVSTARLDRIVDDEVLAPFDHRHLNFDVPEFERVNPTSENLTRVIWDRLSARWDEDGGSTARLFRVLVRETPRNYFEYYGPAGRPDLFKG